MVVGSNRVNRGGSWINNPQNCRVSNRNNWNPDNRNNNIGFRLACAFQLRGMPDSFHRTDYCPARFWANRRLCRIR